jgi:hypothetical protein
VRSFLLFGQTSLLLSFAIDSPVEIAADLHLHIVHLGLSRFRSICTCVSCIFCYAGRGHTLNESIDDAMRCDAMVFVLLLSGEDDSLKRYAANAGQRPEKKIRHSEITAVDPFVSVSTM